MRFKVIDAYVDIPKEIEKAARIGPVKLLLIEAHGNPDQIVFCREEKGVLREEVLDKSMFKGLDEDAVIALKSCNMAKTENALGYKIAQCSQRTVFAPNGSSTSGAICNYNALNKEWTFRSNATDYQFIKIISNTIPNK